MGPLFVSQLGIEPNKLNGETVVVTGAGGGIGYETARALLWLGANVIIAEINVSDGKKAEKNLKAEFDPARVLFLPTDVGDETSVRDLYHESIKKFGKVDVVLNNATIAVLGKVADLPIEKWDASYRVNLRGPVLMARAFLPDMIQRNHGVFICVSSTGTAYLGGYETFKAAQVHLANTLDAELEGTNVFAFTIGPGLVPTATAISAVDQLAPLMGMTVENFYELNKNVVLNPKEAGVGFAVSIVFAEKFKGMEISSIQALKAADINYGGSDSINDTPVINNNQRKQAKVQCEKVLVTLREQSDDWKHRSIFERQWVIRDFRKTAGMSVEEWLAALSQLEIALQNNEEINPPPLQKLADYYTHLAELAKGYEKNAAKLEENLKHVYSWRDEVMQLSSLLGGEKS
jgi:NAD(P)-dependent dehydrogenase (short-subunit alcohol dehydrogenase family)